MDHLQVPEAVLAIDETSFIKKGWHAVGVTRQCRGTAGRIDNCQMSLFLVYASCHSQALLGREHYLPQE